MKKRFFSVLLVLAILAGVIFVSTLKIPVREVVAEDEEASPSDVQVQYDKETIYLWYTDDSLTNYLTSAAVEYNEAHGTRVMPVLKPSVEYFESINKASVESNVPDMYITSHDTLGKAYLAGLTTKIDMDEATFESSYIGQAKNSVLYKDMLLGYPLNYETSVLLYNETYLKDMAVTELKIKQNEAGEDGENSQSDENSSDSSEASFTDEEIANQLIELIPTTIVDITELGNNFDAPEGVESFMTWDVTDIFYNYFFLGNAINVGGEGGFDKSIIDIYNLDAIRSFSAYQELNQFFSIETENSNYSQIISDFIDGKIVLTIATSDVVGTLNQAKADGTFKYDYGVTMAPEINDELDTRSMSVTNCVVINPFSTRQDVANDFSKFVTGEYAVNLFSKSGKVSASSLVNYDEEAPAFNVFAMEYGYSSPLPKMMETSNLWVILEGAFADIWNGEDPNLKLKEVAEKISSQVTGTPVELPYIEDKKEEEEVEYFDEEELARQAKEGEQ